MIEWFNLLLPTLFGRPSPAADSVWTTSTSPGGPTLRYRVHRGNDTARVALPRMEQVVPDRGRSDRVSRSFSITRRSSTRSISGAACGWQPC